MFCGHILLRNVIERLHRNLNALLNLPYGSSSNNGAPIVNPYSQAQVVSLHDFEMALQNITASVYWFGRCPVR